jgi:amidase
MTIHHFTPTRYYNTLGWHEPVLHIQSGDTVITTTVDARGQDVNVQPVAKPGNPMTGPFYVAGAEAGDTLIVRLDKLTPNRSFGWTGTMVAPNVVDPSSTRDLPWAERGVGRLGEWLVDVEQWTAQLLKPATKLAGLSLPLNPMVGCFGVAPAGEQAISTATSGEYGGNMDYNGFVEGVTVYFPVSAPGALFHIGDGHAMQGDGEIAGTGIEISFDVQFTVEVRKGWPISWPRGENAEFIFTVGNARPLDQCVQHATSEMLRWLQSDYGLDAVGAHTLMGQCVKYDLGNIFDPAFTMACKMPKSVLASLK